MLGSGLARERLEDDSNGVANRLEKTGQDELNPHAIGSPGHPAWGMSHASPHRLLSCFFKSLDKQLQQLFGSLARACDASILESHGVDQLLALMAFIPEAAQSIGRLGTGEPAAIQAEQPRSGLLFVAAELDLAIKGLVGVGHPIEVPRFPVAPQQGL